MPDKPSLPTVREALAQAARALEPTSMHCADEHDVGRLEAEILLAQTIKKDRVWLHAHAEDKLSLRDVRRFKKLIHRRKKHEPIAYILGYKDFYGRPFMVNRRTLIPRPETELIIDLVKETQTRLDQPVLIWDLGTGSGAIAVTLACEFPTAHVVGGDVSKDALSIAQKNATTHKATNIQFIQGNLLTPAIKKLLFSSEKPIIITANLPYLPSNDKKILSRDVLDYEPSQALFGGKDGLDIIKKFLKQLHKKSIPFHTLFLEFDPPQAQELRTFVISLFPSVTIQIYQDLAGRNRVMSIVRSK